MAFALFPGTFDPFTNGHLDVLERARRLFDAVEVTVAENSSKSPLFTIEERCALIEASTSHLTGVTVAPFSGLIVERARTLGAVALVRGVRGVTDFDYELRLAAANRRLYPELETVFLIPSEENLLINATFVRDIHRWQGELASFVPPPVLEALRMKPPRTH
ncbi:MAG: pantetheine-phosphate adenylyltransferase [Rhodothermales bacterium]|nr:pantetheine-phosphate adenylyltransferase [Rhodothermales bacterium]